MVHALRVEVASVRVAVVRGITLGVYVEAMFHAVIASEPGYFPGDRGRAIFLLSTKYIEPILKVLESVCLCDCHTLR